MKKYLLPLAFVFFCINYSCQNGDSAKTGHVEKMDSFYIIGKVTGLDTGWIYLIHHQTEIADSVRLDHGFFKFNGKADTAEYCGIQLNEKSRSFFLENGKLSMLVKNDSINDALISGTPAQDEYNQFQDQYSKTISAKMDFIEKLYKEAVHKKDKKTCDSLDKIYDVLEGEKKQLVVEYAKSNPESTIAAFEIYSNFLYDFRVGQLDSAYSMLDPSVRNSYFGKKIQNTILSAKRTEIGSPAPEFSGKDESGKLIKLSSFKGKYVLIDFWASWCGPCRRENPAVVKAYNQFHSKGLNILGVSLDDTRADWLAAIKKDSLNWTQVSDLKGWKSDAADLYGVKGIPMNYLIDKNGVIIAKGLRGEDLESKLAEMLH